MIEKFTDEELVIIKNELGIVDKSAGNKKTICRKEYKRILALYPDTCVQREHGLHPRADIWTAVTLLCDHAICNYAKTEKRVSNMTDLKKWKRYTSIFDKDLYKAMMNEILDVVEKYNVGRNRE